MKIAKNRGNLIIHKQRLNTKVQTQIQKLRYKGSRRHKEEGVTIHFHDVILLLGVVHFHDVILLLGVVVHLFMCEVHLEL